MCASSEPACDDANTPKPLDSNTCAALRASATKSIGRALKDGSLYGTNVGYTRDVYYGRIGKGAELELIDNTPFLEEKYNTRVIKVRVICNATDVDMQGRLGWINMTDTSFSDAFNPTSKKIEL